MRHVNKLALGISSAAQKSQNAMGTVMTHRAFGPHAEACLDAVRMEVERLERLLSCFLPDSDISRLNRSAGMKSEKINPETYTVLSKALELSRSCPGCFAATIEPLVRLWRAGRKSLTLPDAASIWQALQLVEDRDLILEPWEMKAGLRRAGQAIDLGGIGKGFAGDRILEVFKAFGICSACSNLGGNVVTIGAKPDGSPWQIGIQHPRDKDRLIGAVSVTGRTVVTSGDYQRCFTDRQGKRHHHILDPSTGYPARSGLVSVSIVADKSVQADALSTICFVAGLEKAAALLRNFPQTEAVIVDSDLRVYVTRGLKHRFHADGIRITIIN